MGDVAVVVVVVVVVVVGVGAAVVGVVIGVGVEVAVVEDVVVVAAATEVVVAGVLGDDDLPRWPPPTTPISVARLSADPVKNGWIVRTIAFHSGRDVPWVPRGVATTVVLGA